MQKKSLEDRVVVFDSGESLAFKDVRNPLFRAIGEHWERGENLCTNICNETDVYSGLLFKIMNLLMHFVCGAEDPDGRVKIGSANKKNIISVKSSGNPDGILFTYTLEGCVTKPGVFRFPNQ